MATPGVNEQVLDGDKRRVIRLQAELVREGEFFLSGGTGLGLRLGHRLSDDLDWFTPKRFDAQELLARLGRLSERPTRTKQDGRHTVRAYYGTLETSFIAYEQVPARPEQLTVGGTEIPVADIDILAAMKAAVVHDRGAKRDFIDVHAIAGLSDWSLGRFIEHGGPHAAAGGGTGRACAHLLRGRRQGACRAVGPDQC
jgi:Nucleotidyl transferase AbiEii toxin, Type IV TA system